MKLLWHLLALTAVALAVGLLFLREPGFGDDFTYWSFAFDLHERGLRAWQRSSFHDLRWPVWGVCWLFEAIGARGLIAYHAVPLLYLAGGAMLGFAFGKMLTGSIGAGWACGIAFLFHPLLDTVCYRPMPDLSEGVWGAAVMLCWWMAMNAPTGAHAASFAALTGAAVFILEANRITGVFIVPVLAICTLLFFPRRFAWVIAAGVVATLLYGAEAFFYKQLFGDWLHSIHANMGNKGAKGTESIPLWYLPFRFLDSLWKGNPLAPFYCIFAALGIWVASRKPPLTSRQSPLTQPLGRVIVTWFIVLYLEYACAPQGFKGGWNPMLRDADRFLAGLAVPMSVLAAVGLFSLLDLARARVPALRDRLKINPIVCGAIAVAVLAVVTSREFFESGFVPKMRAYMASLAPGTKVFTHEAMRAMAFLVDPSGARRFDWRAPNKILHRDPHLETLAAESDQFWYVRKLVWLTTRKTLEKKGLAEQQPLASYFEHPERDWVMTQLLAKGDTPDLIFLRRRTPADPPPRVLEASAAEFGGLVPPLPAEWKRGTSAEPAPVTWQVPDSLRGRFVRAELEAASQEVEAVAIRLRFFADGKQRAEFLLKPYLHPQPGKEFFAFQIPADATSCEAQLRFSKKAKAVRFTGFRALVEVAK